MKPRPGIVLLDVLALLLVVSAWLPAACDRAQPPAPLTITLAMSPNIYSGLVAIADEKGFFRESGIEVEIQVHASGLAALEKLSKGQAQMATVADLAFTGLALDDPSLRIVASIASSDSVEVVARRDRGIDSPTDLSGKTIGVTFGTVGHYYLSRFLLLNAIPPSAVTTVDLRPDKLVDALANGEVDAAATWDSYSFRAMERLGDKAVVWSAQNTQDYFWVLAVREDMTDSPVVGRVLSALSKADAFALQHNDEARAMVMRRWGFGEEFMRRYWPRPRLGLTLDQALVFNLEEAAAWMLGQGSGQARELPDVTKYLDTRALDAVAPRSVTIFR